VDIQENMSLRLLFLTQGLPPDWLLEAKGKLFTQNTFPLLWTAAEKLNFLENLPVQSHDNK